ncbi:hypothetical protein PILCRDRAFT_794 [Piloderma croceum F 1598]|uniref:Uncharacterized protein n=1 Tax=Piloderma croceum (strain F 1598) TaxID=765440 RepID=A0A0C3BYP0_PILCF|nr:hypothetical protein PILCRDRAFT_794 [Piloderma croceum F 1598]
MAPKVVRCEPDGRWVVYHTPFTDFPYLVHHSHPYYAILNAYLKFSATEEKDMEEKLPEHKLLRDVVEKIQGLWLALHKKRMHPISEGRADDNEFSGSSYDAGGRHGGDSNDEHDGFGSIPMVSNTFPVLLSIGTPAVTAAPSAPYPESVSDTYFSPLFSAAEQIVKSSTPPSGPPELDADDPLSPSDSASVASTGLRSDIGGEEGEDDTHQNSPLYRYKQWSGSRAG